MSALSPADLEHLERTLVLAETVRRGVAPNPFVGCVVVRFGAVIAEGATEPPGGRHAEAVALAAADAPGATPDVARGPCSHVGRTPPCADALVAAGVARVVIAAVDPAPWVDGGGIARLREGGVEVDVLAPDDELARRARRQNAAHRTWSVEGRPHVTYKAAVSLDGRTASRDGDARWISSDASRRLVHEWRAESAVVLVGIGTAIADDPTLTARDCELPPARQPLRVVVDRRARLPLSGRLVETTGEGPVLCLVGEQAPGERRAALEAAGVETAAVGSLTDGLELLARRGASSVLCEGGATIAGALIAAGLVDRLAVFCAPLLLGDPEAPGLLGPALEPHSIGAGMSLVSLEARAVGPDVLLEGWLRDPP